MINPDTEQLKQTQLDLDVAGTESSIVMIEAGANEVTEEKVMDAIYQGHETIKKSLNSKRTHFRSWERKDGSNARCHT